MSILKESNSTYTTEGFSATLFTILKYRPASHREKLKDSDKIAEFELEFNRIPLETGWRINY